MLRVLTTFLSMFLTFSLIQANQTDQTDGYRDKRPFIALALFKQYTNVQVLYLYLSTAVLHFSFVKKLALVYTIGVHFIF